jgi:hypothetical protein
MQPATQRSQSCAITNGTSVTPQTFIRHHDLQSLIPRRSHLNPPQNLQCPTCDHHLRPPPPRLAVILRLNPLRNRQLRNHNPRTTPLLCYRPGPSMLLLWHWRHVRRTDSCPATRSLSTGRPAGNEVVDEWGRGPRSGAAASEGVREGAEQYAGGT